jgi:hypothetical protein
MPDNTEPTQPYKSTLPEIRLPVEGFQSRLPAHLLPSDPNMKWLMEEISKNTQATEFACKAAVMHNEHLRQLNGRTAKNEDRTNDIKAELMAFKDEFAGAAILSKPIASFLYLWQARTFKVIFMLGLFVIVGIGYPYYVSEPGKALVVWLSNWLGE